MNGSMKYKMETTIANVSVEVNFFLCNFDPFHSSWFEKNLFYKYRDLTFTKVLSTVFVVNVLQACSMSSLTPFLKFNLATTINSTGISKLRHKCSFSLRAFEGILEQPKNLWASYHICTRGYGR